MKTKRILTAVCLMVFVLSLNMTAFSGTVSDNNLALQEQTACLDSGIQLYASSSDQPFQAYLYIATKSYGAPNPSTGHVQETVPANTNIWIIEKKLYSGTNRYYYYAGYSYNGQSHRGYFCEDNVYYNGSKLAHSNITAESNPANSKSYTSLATTVYDGPSTSYAVTGSIEEETIKLIRNEGDYNFIQYTVSSTGKIKRGYINYKKIKNVWSSLTAQLVSELEGKTFYIKNAKSKRYLSTVGDNSSANNSRVKQMGFNGKENQIFKFKYNTANKYFCIFPANCYSVDRRLAINTSSNTNHADRHLVVYDRQVVTNQRFWVVKQTNNTYKIVTVASYGTMAIAANDMHDSYINQEYTNTSDGYTYDEWILETTESRADILHYEQGDKNWCWVASAKSMASCEDSFDSSITLAAAVRAVKGELEDNNVTGNIVDKAKAANYFVDNNINSGTFKEHIGKIYSEENIRRIIKDGHAISMLLYAETISIGHSLTMMKFKWIDKEGTDESPGYYYYYYTDPNDDTASPNEIIDTLIEYDYLKNSQYKVLNQPAIWKHSAAYNYSTSQNTMDYDEEN